MDVEWKCGENYNQNYTQDFTEADYEDGENRIRDYWDNTCPIIENTYGSVSTTTTVTTAKILPAVPVLQNGKQNFKQEELLTAEGMYARRGNRFGVRLPAPPIDESRHRMLPQAVAYNTQSDTNGHVGSTPHVGPLDERIGSFICLSTTATPLRLLPQPHQHQQRAYGDDNCIKSDLYINERAGISNRDFVVATQLERPFTSMLPLEYTDYSDCGLNSDNLSAYSDTPPMSNTQHKLQHQRKISLMMAMTTASVIASGETRVPIQRNDINPPASLTDRDSIVHFVTEKWSLAPATTRKLPKRLPSPQYKAPVYPTPTLTTTANTVVSAQNLNGVSVPSQTFSEKSYRTKQLPTLPISKNSLNSNVSSNLDVKSNPKSNLSINANLALLSDIEIDHLASASSYSDHKTCNSSVIENSVAKSSANVDLANNFDQLAEEEYTFTKYSNSVDILNSWPIKTSPPHSSSFVTEYLKTLKQPIDKVKELEGISSVRTADTTKLEVTESSSFDISEYLKPYSLDSSKFCTNDQIGYKMPAITTKSTSSTIPSIKQNESTHCFSQPCLESHCEYLKDSINTDTKSTLSRDSSSVAVDSTPSNDSSPVSKMLSMPINFKSSSTCAKVNTKSVCDNITEAVLNDSSIGNVFTTTNLATSLSTINVDNSSIPAANTTESEMSITFQSSPSLTYMDYMKKFELPELPPIPDISPTVISGLVSVAGACADSPINTVTENVAIDSSTVKTTAAGPDTKHYFDEFSLTSYACTDSAINAVTGSSTENTTNAEPDTKHYFDEFNSTLYVDTGKISETSSFGHIETILDGNMLDKNPLLSYQLKENEKVITNKITCFPFEENCTKTIELPERLTPVSRTVTFDDSFYDSFNVDLSALTATIAHINTETISTPAISQCTDLKDEVNTDELNRISSFQIENEQGRYYEPSSCSPSKNLPLSSSSLIIETPLKTKPTSKALGGLSKGLMGGLDGVLAGVGGSQIVSGNSSKKSFSFNLASKLVPSVGGLLSSGNKTTLATTSIVKSSIESQNIDSKSTAFGYGLVYEYSPESVNLTATIDYPTSHLLEMHSDDSSYDTRACPDLKSTPNYEYLIDNNPRDGEPNFSDDSRKAGLCEEEFDYSSDPTNGRFLNKIHSAMDCSSKETYKVVPDNIPIERETNSSQPAVGKTGGMFGSIFGKAAAAVQSATLAVNQSASSVASAVTQKASSIPSGSKLNVPVSGVLCSNKIVYANEAKEGYHVSLDNDYNDSTKNEEHVAGQYSVGGDDYENSNTHLSLDYNIDNDNRRYAVYYSDCNHSQSNNIITDESKLLPEILPAAFSGKKLPTINGKSGMLIKQQPTEIYDNETRQHDDGAIIEDISGYHFNSERNDYYLKHQQTTKSSRGGAEDYYEHVDYDYREDFFNEEDEYKYLEQQRRQQIIQTQSSRDYMDERHDDDEDVAFSDANYPSDEDCGNYPDESSSGSIPVIVNTNSLSKGEVAPCISATCPSTIAIVASCDQADASVSLQLAASHQQIKKQDSIIIEEDDIHDVLSLDQVTDEADQFAELESIKSKSLKKKKILMRGETEEVVGGHMQILRKPEITAKQRWHWAYNKIIIQINVSTLTDLNYYIFIQLQGVY